MTQQELDILKDAFKANLHRSVVSYGDLELPLNSGIAAVATAIDYLRGDIQGLAPRTPVAVHPTKDPEATADPDPLGTEAMKTLGSLGVQSLSELTGYKYDNRGHILLHINGRCADSGWKTPDIRLTKLQHIMENAGLPFPQLT